ncbi:MAG: hypothetical protein AABY05_03205 [Nanoarchaeota archaeon]
MYGLCIIYKMEKKKFVITKKIAKHGNQAIIVIPRVLENQLKPGTIAQVTIDIIDNLEVAE